MTLTLSLRPRMLRAPAAALLFSMAALLAGCNEEPLPPTRFAIDLCGTQHQWEDAETRWDTLYAAQLDGDDELVLALGIRDPDEGPPAATGVQFNLAVPPDLLRQERIAALAGSFPLGAGMPPSSATHAENGGTGTVFRHPAEPWHARSGELRITDVHVIAQGEGGEARAVVSGSYAMELDSNGTATTSQAGCAVHGRFEGATFRLRHQDS